ncbi:DUF2063 domain-containing protein [Afipia massiliensis]|uniref:DUF2063 domain-containing protein n=1 Tax=Afipia massiliensis TaxID=211460 RepID=A0A4U6BKS2_9BRAD|nr:DNA-binding domain-containing protein [Afipia massiliensis]TKT70812.1 DUF2063 domain-containing protein [Afipia massiliensis]
MFADMQAIFIQALLDPDKPVPASVTSYRTGVPVKRFAVYRNNVIAGLVEAMRAGFPIVERIVGADFFAATARLYAINRPPRSPLMLRYGDDFPEFLSHFPPAAELPYLADVARLELARRLAYHAADAEPLRIELITTLTPDALAESRLTIHPSVSIVRSRHPIFTIWAMNSGDIELTPIDEDAAEDALVTRANLEVTVHRMFSGGAAFLQCLMAGNTFGAAASTALKDNADFDLTANLAMLIGSGAIIDVQRTAEGVPNDQCI